MFQIKRVKDADEVPMVCKYQEIVFQEYIAVEQILLTYIPSINRLLSNKMIVCGCSGWKQSRLAISYGGNKARPYQS